jgi:hypothetical protein
VPVVSDFSPADEVIVHQPTPSAAGHERQTAAAELPVIHLDFPDPNRIFPAVLRFIYEVGSPTRPFDSLVEP